MCTARFLDSSASAQSAGPERGFVLKIAAIHQEPLPQEWATQVSQRAIRLLGPSGVSVARWTVGALRDPGVLRDAAEAAIEADMLVVSVCAAAELPLDLNRWIDSWLPYRRRQDGALVAVIGVPQAPSAYPRRIRGYLHDVAGLAHLSFLSQERRLPWEFLAFRGSTFGRVPSPLAVGQRASARPGV
jgi:hypothetical protein